MEISFSEYFAKQSKAYHAQWGPNKIFGEDIDERRKMNDPELVARFDQVWSEKLKNLIEQAKPSIPERKDVIYKKLGEISRNSKYQKQNFFYFDDEHREFRIYGIDGVAQLHLVSGLVDGYELNNIWFFFAGDEHPDWLIIRFDTAKERERFAEIARSLNQEDEKLGKELIRDFMKKFDKS